MLKDYVMQKAGANCAKFQSFISEKIVSIEDFLRWILKEFMAHGTKL